MAKTTKAQEASYEELSSELNEVLLALQQDDVDIDAALNYYESGLKLVEQLKKYLESAENKISKLQPRNRDN